MLRVLEAQGQQVPAGMTVDQFADTALAVAIGTVVVISVLALIAAVGSFLGWRWMFWVALVLFGLGTFNALGNIGSLVKPSTSPYPIGVIVFNELIALAGVGMFVWMLIGAIKFGPWAMKKPGA